MLEALVNIDKQIFLFLNGINSPFWDVVMWHISATVTWIPLYALVLFFVFKKYKTKGFVVLGALILVVLIADQGSVMLFKNVVKRFRPCHDPTLAGFVHLVNDKCGGNYGFISSHASNTFAFATFISFFYKNKIISLSFVSWALIVCYSRIYLGVHFPGDVLGGVIFGFLTGLFVYKLLMNTSVFRDETANKQDF